jgi:protease I
MKSSRRLAVLALCLLFLPLVCFAQTPPRAGAPAQANRGTMAPRRGGTPDTVSQSPGRRSSRGVLKNVQLPAPTTSGSISVEAALTRIQSLSAPSDQPLKLPEVGQLAWAAQGRAAVTISGATGLPVMNEATVDERAMMKVYFAMADGLYLYTPGNHSLQETRSVDVRASLSSGLLGQQNAPVGGCQVVIAGSSKDFSARYGSNRARNVMLLLAGQMAQNVQLQAVALNMTFVGINNVDVATARRLCGLTREAEPLYVVVVGYPATAPAGQTTAPGSFKKAVIIVPQNGFRDEEFFETKRGLEFNSMQVLVASMRAGTIKSMTGVSAQADLAISDVRAGDFSVLVLVGGMGTTELVNNRVLWDLIRQAVAQRRVVAASGSAPLILANAGVLKGVRVTGAPEIQNMLVGAGAAYTGRPVEKDGFLVTSMGPGAQIFPVFIQAILDGLTGT